jgi:hypothetical protein
MCDQEKCVDLEEDNDNDVYLSTGFDDDYTVNISNSCHRDITMSSITRDVTQSVPSCSLLAVQDNVLPSKHQVHDEMDQPIRPIQNQQHDAELVLDDKNVGSEVVNKTTMGDNHEQDLPNYKNQFRDVVTTTSHWKSSSLYPSKTTKGRIEATESGNRKPGVIYIAGMRTVNRSHEVSIRNTSGIEPTIGYYDDQRERTVQVDDAVLVGPTIGIAEPMTVPESNPTHDLGNNKRKVFTFSFALLATLMLCAAVIIGTCLSGKCSRSSSSHDDHGSKTNIATPKPQTTSIRRVGE